MQHQIAQRINGEITAPAWHLLDMAFATSADYVIAPLQDLMHLDDEARFNTPGTTVGNWIWRLQSFDNKLEGAIKGYGERGGSGAVIRWFLKRTGSNRQNSGFIKIGLDQLAIPIKQRSIINGWLKTKIHWKRHFK